MKKTFIALLLTCFVLTSYGQDEKIAIGLRGGLNIASISNTGSASASFGGYGSSVKYKSRLAPHFGVYSEIKFNDFISLQPEVLFSMKGYKYESSSSGGGSSSEYTLDAGLNYIDIPLQLRFNFGKGFHLLGGPSFSILMSAKAKSESTVTSGGSTVTTKETDTDKEGLNTMDVGVYIGVGYQLDMGLNFAIRWARGFSNLYEDDGSTVTIHQSNNVFQFTVGYNLLKF